MAIVTKRTVMSLYSGSDDVYSHQVRIVLAEKGVNAEVIDIDDEEAVRDLQALNPYSTIPTLLDRELILYEAPIIMEYLDERFPHPPLLPVYPVARAETRKMLHRIEKDWYTLMKNIYSGNNADSAREQLLTSIVNLEPVFASKPFFLSDEFSLLDCALAPLLWRFPQMEIKIPESFTALNDYIQRIFLKESFEKSLTDAERQLRAA